MNLKPNLLKLVIVIMITCILGLILAVFTTGYDKPLVISDFISIAI